MMKFRRKQIELIKILCNYLELDRKSSFPEGISSSVTTLTVVVGRGLPGGMDQKKKRGANGVRVRVTLFISKR